MTRGRDIYLFISSMWWISDDGNLLTGHPHPPRQPLQINQIWRKHNNLKSCVSFVSAALKQLHGIADCDGEREDIEKERNNLSGLQAKKPWELFADRSLRWQVLTIILLNAAQQLNGINAVRTQCPHPTTTTLETSHKDEKEFSKKLKVMVLCLFLYLFSTLPLDLLLRRLRVQTVWYSQW